MHAVHPGDGLREEYLAPRRLNVSALAMALVVLATCIHEIVNERRGVTAERLARHFGGDAASWLALRADYDLKTLATRGKIARKVSTEHFGCGPLEIWWRIRDSNPGPADYDSVALTD